MEREDRKIILLRNHSDESRRAVSVLERYGIKHGQLFCDDLSHNEPELLTFDFDTSINNYRGVANIEWYILGELNKRMVS